MAINPGNIRRTNWDVTFKGTALDLVDQVKPDLKLQLDPITAGSTGKLVLGHRVVGFEGSVSIVVREVTLARIKALGAPWWSSGLVPVGGPETPNVDLYIFAGALVLHPRELGATTDQDITLLKAVPTTAYAVTRDGTKDDAWQVDFNFYPDRDQLAAATPKVVYGYIGAAA